MKSFVSGNPQQPSPQKEGMRVIENLTASSRQEEGPLDTYSRTVREVTEKLEPAVTSVGLPNGRGGGSGVIIGSDGESATAVTNSHVVRGLSGAGRRPGPGLRSRGGEGFPGLAVALTGSASVPAEVLGEDPPSDLAVVCFTPEEEPAVAELGEAGNLVVGQLVVAIGSPLGFQRSVTAPSAQNWWRVCGYGPVRRAADHAAARSWWWRIEVMMRVPSVDTCAVGVSAA